MEAGAMHIAHCSPMGALKGVQVKNLKYLGFAVTAALLAVASVGAGSASATKLCKVEPTGNPLTCPVGEVYKGESFESILETGVNAKFVRLKGGLAGEVTCNESSIDGKLKEEGASPAKGGITLAEFKNGGKVTCPSTFFGKPEVEVSVLNLPYEESVATYIGVAAPQGKLEIKKNVEIKVRVLAEPEFSCLYRPKLLTILTAELENATKTTETKAIFKGSLFELFFGGASCPTEIEFSATYQVRRSNPNGKLYIAN
jgi:hypothetical protein